MWAGPRSPWWRPARLSVWFLNNDRLKVKFITQFYTKAAKTSEKKVNASVSSTQRWNQCAVGPVGGASARQAGTGVCLGKESDCSAGVGVTPTINSDDNTLSALSDVDTVTGSESDVCSSDSLSVATECDVVTSMCVS